MIDQGQYLQKNPIFARNSIILEQIAVQLGQHSLKNSSLHFVQVNFQQNCLPFLTHYVIPGSQYGHPLQMKNQPLSYRSQFMVLSFLMPMYEFDQNYLLTNHSFGCSIKLSFLRFQTRFYHFPEGSFSFQGLFSFQAMLFQGLFISVCPIYAYSITVIMHMGWCRFLDHSF